VAEIYATHLGLSRCLTLRSSAAFDRSCSVSFASGRCRCPRKSPEQPRPPYMLTEAALTQGRSKQQRNSYTAYSLLINSLLLSTGHP
jgi:hypothetical protein